MVAPALGRAVAAHVAVAVDALWVGVDDSRCLGAVGRAARPGLPDRRPGCGPCRRDGAVRLGAANSRPPSTTVRCRPSRCRAPTWRRRSTASVSSYVLDTYEAQESRRAPRGRLGLVGGPRSPSPPGRLGHGRRCARGLRRDLRRGRRDLGERCRHGPGASTRARRSRRPSTEPAPRRRPRRRQIVRQAREAFARTAGALGDPAPAESPEPDYVAPLMDASSPTPAARRWRRTGRE